MVSVKMCDENDTSSVKYARDIFLGHKVVIELSVGAFRDVHKKTCTFIEEINGACTSVLSWLHR